MDRQKYLYALLICLSLALVTVPRIVHSANDGCSYNPEVYRGLELSKLSEELNDNGLVGRIHGAVPASQLFVMSVREPDNFFSHREFSLIAEENSLKALDKANRHDLVCVRGNIIDNPSPQKHIKLNSVQILAAWQQPEGFPPYQREAVIPEELKQQASLIGKVHAIGDRGKILVIGYKDGILPIFVRETKHTKDLYRGDIVKLAYQIQSYPERPSHLQLDSTVTKPVEIIDAIADSNGQAQTLSGSLVKFPQSPQLKFDVYAMEVDTQGIKRYFTLINFDDMTKFTQIREKLAKLWDDHADTAVSGRNKLINPAVTIEATGIASIISTEQANPQILLDSAEQVKRIN